MLHADSSEGFGITIHAVRDSSVVVVSGFRRSQMDGRMLPAERSGQIQLGDELVTVNGVSVDSLAGAIAAVRDAGDSVLLRLRSFSLRV